MADSLFDTLTDYNCNRGRSFCRFPLASGLDFYETSSAKSNLLDPFSTDSINISLSFLKFASLRFSISSTALSWTREFGIFQYKAERIKQSSEMSWKPLQQGGHGNSGWGRKKNPRCSLLGANPTHFHDQHDVSYEATRKTKRFGSKGERNTQSQSVEM
jgi:hypothetical protein